MLEIEAKRLIYDNEGIMGVKQFLFNMMSWAMNTDDDFDKVLSDIEVVSIMHNKVPEAPEHEFLIVETVDREGTKKHFILERMMSKILTIGNPPTEVYRGTKLLPLVKDLVNSICSSDDELSNLESGTFGSSVPDKAFLTSIESVKVISEHLDKKEKLENVAIDRFLGEAKVFEKRWHGQIVQYFKPNDLTLFQLAIIADVINKLFPTYTSLDKHCYFFAALVYAIAKDVAKIRPSVNADEGGDMRYTIDSHLADRFGRWKGLKVASVDPELVYQIVKVYKKEETKMISSVRFNFMIIIIVSDTFYRSRNLISRSLSLNKSMQSFKNKFDVSFFLISSYLFYLLFYVSYDI
jgi:hypothetical protein